MNINVKINEHDLKRLQSLKTEFLEGFYRGMQKAMKFAESKSKKSFGEPNHLNVVTGYLRRSIQSGAERTGGNVIGWLSSETKYSAIHENGGIIKPRIGEYLRFKIAGNWKTVKEVIIPQRSYLRQPIEDNMSKMVDIIEKEIEKDMNKP